MIAHGTQIPTESSGAAQRPLAVAAQKKIGNLFNFQRIAAMKLRNLCTGRIFFLAAATLSISLLYGRLAALYAPSAPESVSSAELAGPSAGPSEDAQLFAEALRLGLLRTDAHGRIAVAPADLPLRRRWIAEHPDLLAPSGADEPNWLNGPWNEEVSRWHRTLHFSASGRYVRQQIEAFNQQRPEFPHIQQREGRLVWRSRP